MKNLIIIGAGGFGREVLQYALDTQASSNAGEWNVAGFLDDNANALSGYSCGYPIFGTVKEHVVSDENVYICSIGDVRAKLSICEEYLNRGARFINLIHPTAIVGRTCKMGTGNILCPFSSLTTDVAIGNFVTLNQKAGCGHDAVIGNGCAVSAFCDITGGASLGEGVFLGSHAVICPGVKVGDYARIGAGSVVLRDVKAGGSVFGIPAKKLF